MPRYILPVIVLAQFCCTSLWFAGNGVMNELVEAFGLQATALGHLTSAVQFGFITGTLIFAFLTIADRFSPSKVFFVCALLGALFNLGTIWEANQLWSLMGFRFLTGFCLAGIYPVGMKIAADYFPEGLGKALGYLVGALVVGTAFPHLVKDLTGELPWRTVLITTSLIAALGGIVLLILVPNGPYRSGSQQLDLGALFSVFRNRSFRAAAFGYFGHMWELYTFWAFVPVMLYSFGNQRPDQAFNIPLWSFLIIGLGGVACVVGGYLSQRYGPKRVAFTALLLSAACCLVSPLIFLAQSKILLLGFLLFWGGVVITDSPQFSTLVATHAPAEKKGTALTIVNSIGFAITIVSIQLVTWSGEWIAIEYIFVLLGVGPLLGLLALRRG